VSLWNLEFSERAGRERLGLVLCFNRSPSNGLNLGLELWRNLFQVFRSVQTQAQLLVTLIKFCLIALTDGGGDDVGHVVRELANVLTNTIQETGSAKMVTHFYQSFRKLVAVDHKQSLTKLKLNSHISATDVLECI
jgi:hypothetical protein